MTYRENQKCQVHEWCARPLGHDGHHMGVVEGKGTGITSQVVGTPVSWPTVRRRYRMRRWLGYAVTVVVSALVITWAVVYRTKALNEWCDERGPR